MVGSRLVLSCRVVSSWVSRVPIIECNITDLIGRYDGTYCIQEDACSGIALLYMGPSGTVDEHVEKLQLAMESGDSAEAEHQSAIMLVRLVPTLSRKSLEFASTRWRKAFPGGESKSV